MNPDNKTILIVGLLIVTVISMILGIKDLALAVSGGLVGYLSKDPHDNNSIEDDTNKLE